MYAALTVLAMLVFAEAWIIIQLLNRLLVRSGVSAMTLPGPLVQPESPEPPEMRKKMFSMPIDY